MNSKTYFLNETVSLMALGSVLWEIKIYYLCLKMARNL